MLREAKKMRKELRALLEYARTRVAELETQNLDARLEIDSLKASPVVSDEVECADSPIFLADLGLFKKKRASKCEELDVLRVEEAELKSRPALLGACTSCPVLHGKIDEMHAYTVSLEAKLKEPIPTSCSTCELLQTNHFQKPIKFVGTSEKVFFGKRVRRLVRRNRWRCRVEINQVSSPNPSLSLCL
jgi:hypothetical protein